MNVARILIVDDDPKLSRFMAAVLEKAGHYEVREENRSFAALATARAFAPDLILMDVDMPGKSGGDVAAEFRQDPSLRRLPLIFVTSLVTKTDLGGSVAMRGHNLFISKPTSPQVLLDTVGSVLSGALASC